MSNKNYVNPNKYKWNGANEQVKTTNSGNYKQANKLASQYSSVNTAKHQIKNYKIISLHRAGSDTELRKNPLNRYNPASQHLVSAEEEYYAVMNNLKPSPINTDNHNRNFLKQTASTSSIDIKDIRRYSPISSPSFIRGMQQPRKNFKQKKDEISKQNFTILKKIGEGKFGKVYLAIEKNTGMIMAMKVQEKRRIVSDNLLQQFLRQLKIQVFLNHPNIIDIYGFFDDETYFYTLQELGSDGQLYNIISQHQNLTQEATSFIIKNLLEAVNFMHQKKILHRDIKPENIVLTMGNVKLCDFGWAVNKIKKQELRSTFCGTPLYLSPELLKGQKYDEKVDLWAIGILSYQLLLGCSPFEINQQQDLFKILTQQVQFPKGIKVSPQFQQFIGFILNKNPKERLPSWQLLKLAFIRKYQDFQTCEELCR